MPGVEEIGKNKPIPISSAKDIANSFGYDQVIVIGRHVGEAGCEHVTTYGKGKDHCRAAAKVGDFLKYKVMGWPEYDEVDRLRRELAETRRARLSELLEAEARERVEVDSDFESFTTHFSVGGVSWAKVREGVIFRSPRHVTNMEQLIDSSACLSAALAEKRKRMEQADG